jgi:hypothetical protein
MTDQAKKIKILATRFEKTSGMIYWKVIFLEDNKEMTLAWPKQDLIPALLGKKLIDFVLPDEEIEKFCHNILGKEISLIITCGMQMPSDLKNLTTERIQKLAQNLDQFPFYEVCHDMGLIQKEDGEKK